MVGMTRSRHWFTGSVDFFFLICKIQIFNGSNVKVIHLLVSAKKKHTNAKLETYWEKWMFRAYVFTDMNSSFSPNLRTRFLGIEREELRSNPHSNPHNDYEK